MSSTPNELLPLIAAGAQVVVRDEEWLVRAVQQTPADGLLVQCIGTSTLVRDTEATFFTALDHVEPMRPEETRLVADDSPNFRRSRLYLEAMIRKTPVPATETGLAVSQQLGLAQQTGAAVAAQGGGPQQGGIRPGQGLLQHQPVPRTANLGCPALGGSQTAIQAHRQHQAGAGAVHPATRASRAGCSISSRGVSANTSAALFGLSCRRTLCRQAPVAAIGACSRSAM